MAIWHRLKENHWVHYALQSGQNTLNNVLNWATMRKTLRCLNTALYTFIAEPQILSFFSIIFAHVFIVSFFFSQFFSLDKLWNGVRSISVRFWSIFPPRYSFIWCCNFSITKCADAQRERNGNIKFNEMFFLAVFWASGVCLLCVNVDSELEKLIHQR